MAEQALQIQHKNNHTLDQRFIKNLKGKDFVLYTGLLDLGHQIGIQSVNVEPIQFPNKENGNEAIIKAVVTSVDGRTFTEIGDANPKNVNSQIAAHVIRMAATRAKARALRDMTNIGMTCLEELGEVESVIGSDESNVIPLRQKTKQRSENDSPKTENTEKKAQNQHSEKTHGTAEEKAPEKKPDARISNAQRSAILNLAKRKGILDEDLFRQIEEVFGVTIDNLSSSDASSYIKTLQKYEI